MISTSTMRSQDGQQAAGLSRPKNNASSIQLTPDENEAVFRLLGRKSQTLNTAVVQIYKTEGSAHSHWKKKYTGVLCFIKDSAKRSYFLRAYCLIKNELIWEHEIYDNMQIVKSRPFLLTFEGEDGYVGLNFVSEDECDSFFRIVDATIETRNRKRLEKRNRPKSQQAPSVPVQPARPPSLQGKSSSPMDNDDKVKLRNNKISSVTLTPTPPATKNFLSNNFGMNASGGKDKKRKVTKADISKPTNFIHISHVGWDANKGFDLSGNDSDEMLNNFFAKAGVSESELNDRDTRAFIYDFIESNNVLVKLEESPTESTRHVPPPVPSRQIHHSQNGNQRSAPPPPPARQPPPPLPTTAPGAARAPAPPSRPPPINTAPPPPPQATVCPPTAAPPPPPSTAPPSTAPLPAAGPAPTPPPPPPPPPPMPALEMPIVAIPQQPSQAKPALPVETDSRSALMDDIRKGAPSLKHVVPGSVSSGSGDVRNDLLGQIREGYVLRPVTERKLPEQRNSDNSTKGTDALAEALRRALKSRVIAMHPEDEESATSSENEWSE